MATTIGEQLRLSREQQGIPLREISNQTRISMRYLEAIEGNDYKRLPGGIFNRSFVKAYARCVGFDETQAVEGYSQYLREQGHPVEDDVPMSHYSKVYTESRATRSPALTVVLAILMLGILTFAAVALTQWYKRRQAAAPASGQATAESMQDRGEPRGRLVQGEYERKFA